MHNPLTEGGNQGGIMNNEIAELVMGCLGASYSSDGKNIICNVCKRNNECCECTKEEIDSYIRDAKAYPHK